MKGKSKKMDRTLRLISLTGLTMVLLTAAVWLGILCFARFHYDRGIVQYKTADYAGALEHLQKAEKILVLNSQGWFFLARLCNRDLFRIQTAMGKTYCQLAGRAKLPEASYALLRKGSISLNRALTYDSGSYRTLFWAAHTMAGLERIWPTIVNIGGKNPYDALPFYERAIALRPSGKVIHYDLIGYLYQKKQTERLPGLVSHMVRIAPSMAGDLKGAPFYTALKDKVKQGLLKAFEDGTTLRTTLFFLSDMALADNDFDSALRYYKQALMHGAKGNNTATRVHLGMLFLKKGDIPGAQGAFVNAVRKTHRFEFTLALISRAFQEAGRPSAFLLFLDHLEDTMYPSVYIDLARSACLVETGQMKRAKTLLARINQQAPQARAYDLLAKIAQGEKDWDAMEIAAQNATFLDPENSRYWIRLSMALGNLGKVVPAQEAATRAISFSDMENAWYYAHRASLYFDNKEFNPAITDLKKALSINGEYTWACHLMARAYQGLNRPGLALEFINKAIGLAPENQSYIKFKKALTLSRSPSNIPGNTGSNNSVF